VKRNEGTIDRVIRVVLALAAGGAAVAIGISSLWGIVLLVVAAILLVTAAVGFCPLYRLLGMSTCPAPGADAPRQRTGAAS
jgi:fatty acid desaturase